MIGQVCIVGAGAIGGLIGTRLAAAGQTEVCALARGATLEALRHGGWQLESADGQRLQVPTRASDRPADLGRQDLVVIAVKGPALAGLAPTLAPLLGPDTIVLPAMNGVPWWFCQRIPGFAGTDLRSVDPEGRIASAIGHERVLGAVVRGFCSTAMQEAALIGRQIGCPIDEAPEARHAVTARLGAFRTSMLQDTEAGRSSWTPSWVPRMRSASAWDWRRPPSAPCWAWRGSSAAYTVSIPKPMPHDRAA